MSSLKVIITGSNRLATFGLRRMLNEVFDVDAHIVDAGDLDALVTTVEPDLFFIDTASFIARLSFFSPMAVTTPSTTASGCLTPMPTARVSSLML